MIDTGSMLSKDFGWQRGKEITLVETYIPLKSPMKKKTAKMKRRSCLETSLIGFLSILLSLIQNSTCNRCFTSAGHEPLLSQEVDISGGPNSGEGWWIFGEGWWIFGEGWWIFGEGWWIFGEAWWFGEGWWIFDEIFQVSPVSKICLVFPKVPEVQVQSSSKNIHKKTKPQKKEDPADDNGIKVRQPVTTRIESSNKIPPNRASSCVDLWDLNDASVLEGTKIIKFHQSPVGIFQ